MYIKCITFFSVSPTEFESVCFYAHTVFVALYFLLSSGVMPTKPGSCALPCYGIEFAVLDPVVSTILSLCVIYICSPLLYNSTLSDVPQSPISLSDYFAAIRKVCASVV